MIWTTEKTSDPFIFIMRPEISSKEFVKFKIDDAFGGKEIDVTSQDMSKDRIIFTGFVENIYIHEYYIMADIVVIPSIVDSSGFQEGFPVVLIESFAAGKAVISTKTKGIMEAIQDRYNGILVDQKDADKISDALLELLRDEVLRERISANALESGKKYDWDIIANEYLRLFEVVSFD